MTTKAETVKRPAAESARVCQGDCPLRSTPEDERFDSCPSCPSLLRQCPSCHEFKEQAGFWWGSVWGRTHWVCADDRFDLDAATIAKHPDLAATHPDYPRLVAGRDRFEVTLELDGDEQRYAVAAALARGSQVYHEAAAVVLARLAEAFRQTSDGEALSVDVADVDAAARRRVEALLHSVAYSSHTSQRAARVIVALMRAWEGFAAEVLPSPPRPLTDAQRREQERLQLRHGRERRVD